MSKRTSSHAIHDYIISLSNQRNKNGEVSRAKEPTYGGRGRERIKASRQASPGIVRFHSQPILCGHANRYQEPVTVQSRRDYSSKTRPHGEQANVPNDVKGSPNRWYDIYTRSIVLPRPPLYRCYSGKP